MFGRPRFLPDSPILGHAGRVGREPDDRAQQPDAREQSSTLEMLRMLASESVGAMKALRPTKHFPRRSRWRLS
jgi:hypothetical protein